MRIPSRFLVKFVLLVASPGLLGGCGELLVVPISGWWRVDLVDSTYELSSDNTRLASLLETRGCSLPPGSVRDHWSLINGEPEMPGEGLFIRLDDAGIVRETRSCLPQFVAEGVECSTLETGPAGALPSFVLPAGDFLHPPSTQETGTGEFTIELHSEHLIDAETVVRDEQGELLPEPVPAVGMFPASDIVTKVRVRWERFVEYAPVEWRLGRGTVRAVERVEYTLLDPVPPGHFAYPSQIFPSRRGELATDAIPAGTTARSLTTATFELRRDVPAEVSTTEAGPGLLARPHIVR